MLGKIKSESLALKSDEPLFRSCDHCDAILRSNDIRDIYCDDCKKIYCKICEEIVHERPHHHCESCALEIRGFVCFIDGEPICSDCNKKEIQTCLVCSRVIPDGEEIKYNHAENNIMCRSCYEISEYHRKKACEKECNEAREKERKRKREEEDEAPALREKLEKAEEKIQKLESIIFAFRSLLSAV